MWNMLRYQVLIEIIIATKQYFYYEASTVKEYIATSIELDKFVLNVHSELAVSLNNSNYIGIEEKSEKILPSS